MRYALLVCVEENAAMTNADAERQYAQFMAFQDEMEGRGVLVARERLRPTSLATTVRVRDEGLVVADGPFAETKEQIAGFYIIECRRSGRGDRDRLAQSWRQERHDRGQAGVGDLADAQAGCRRGVPHRTGGGSSRT